MARDPYAAAAAPVTRVHKGEQAAARKRRRALAARIASGETRAATGAAKRERAAAVRALQLEAQQEVVDRHSAGLATTAFVSKPTAKAIQKDIRSPERRRARQRAARRQALEAGFMNRSVSTIFNIPMGAAVAGANVGLDIYDIRRGDLDFERTRKLGKEAVVGSIESLKHPGRDPAAALLTVFGIASLGATAVAKLSVGATLAKQGNYAAAAKAMGRKPPPGPRVFKSPSGFETQGIYSRNALSEAWQRTHDFYLHKLATRKPEGAAAGVLDRAIGQAERKRRLATEAIEAAPAAGVARYHLTTPQQVALRLVAEGVSPAERAATLRAALSQSRSATDKVILRRKLRLTTAAAKYVDIADGQPTFSQKGQKLQQVYADTRAVAKSREDMLIEIERLTPEAAERRVDAPGRLYRGGEYAEGQGIVGGEGSAGDFRVPYKKGIGRPPSGRVGGASRIGFEPNAPGTLTHPFTGALLRSGRYREAVTKLVAEDALEAQNYRRILAIRERYRDAARPVRQDGDIPIRLSGGRISERAKELLAKAEEEGTTLSRTERRQLGDEYEAFRRDAFPENYTNEQLASGEIGFIPAKWLGHANEPRDYAAMLGGSPRKMVGAWDTLNNAAKLALVYAKIGYIAPNLLGNVILNFLQQGFLALPNLARATNATRKLTPTEAAWFDSLMGAGISRALISDTRAPLSKVTSKVADIVSTPTDRYTRRASLFYEFDRRGYGTTAKIRDLKRRQEAGEPEAQAHLTEIVRRARENAIEYENLTPLERTVWQRIIFIYPWVKGSTTYTARYLRDHPIQAAALYQLGAQYGDESARDIMQPSYMEGQGRIGGTDERPQMLDLRGASPFGTVGDIAGMGMSVAQSKTPQRFIPSEFLNPALQLVAGQLLQVNPQTRTPLPAGTSPGEYLWESFGKTLPQVQAYQGIRGDQPDENKIVQRSVAEQRARILLGSLGPSTQSRANLEAAAVDEAKGLLPVQKRSVLSIREDRDKFELELARVGATDYLAEGGLSPNAALAWKHREMRERALAHIRPTRRATRKQRFQYQSKRLAVDYSLAKRIGKTPNSTMKEVLDWAAGDPDKIETYRTKFGGKYFGGDYIAAVREWVRENYDDSFDR